MKKIMVAVALCFSMLFCGNLLAAEQVQFTYNGAEIAAEQSGAEFREGNLYVSLDFIADQLGLRILKEEKNIVRLTGGVRILLLQTGGNQALGVVDRVTGETEYVDMNSPAWAEGDKVMVPLRAVVESAGGSLLWDSAAATAHIQYHKDALEGALITFTDPGIEAIARYVAGHSLYGGEESYQGEFRQAQADVVTILAEEYLPQGVTVNSISDIVHFPNLTYLSLSDQNISDITPLSYKTSWNMIFLDGNPIQNISSLDNLQIQKSLVLPYYYYYTRESDAPVSLAEQQEYALSILEYKQVHKEVQSFLQAEIKEGMSDQDKVKAIHDFVVNRADYDYEYMSASDKNLLFELLVNGKAICGGYAATVEELCRLAGIDCMLIFGDAYGISEVGTSKAWEGHVWNIVTIDGKKYHLDATYDDPIYVRNGKKVESNEPISYDYYLISDKEMKVKKNHRWNESEYPACP